MRIYKTIREGLDEIARDLKVRGITVECKSHQDKKLEGDGTQSYCNYFQLLHQLYRT